ncbi:MAG: putative toxin-antitoxin system toxin component, PIN family [Mycobacteriales bacterium]
MGGRGWIWRPPSSTRCAGRSARRAVFDPGVLVSALITSSGTPAKLLANARGGKFELIVSPLLLAELEEVLCREKFRRYVGLDAVSDYLDLLRRLAVVAADPEAPRRCARSTPMTTI